MIIFMFVEVMETETTKTFYRTIICRKWESWRGNLFNFSRNGYSNVKDTIIYIWRSSFFESLLKLINWREKDLFF